ncbi:P-II family nitrogen regulator [Bdellovibrio bacteriovorus]|uniref:P-II family nitrogen regulator n=1 Tax=Bdellovibrio bacteriovorus TaxID=959 RepID=UPI0035A6F8DA
MKEIKAIVKENMLSDVIWALHQVEGLTGVTMTEVFGYGRSKAKNSEDKVTFASVEAVPRIKLEIVCSDNLVNTVVSTIQKNAHTGLRGDGKIFVSEISDSIRIGTNERGENTIQI